MNKPSSAHSSGMVAGIPVITGTRVPIRRLADHLKAGGSIDVFLRENPTVSIPQINRLIVSALEALITARASGSPVGKEPRD